MIGMLALPSATPGRYNDRHARIVLAIANQAALAIENARLFAALQERLAQVEGLSVVGAALIEERDLNRVLCIIGEQARRLLGVAGCSIVLLDMDNAARRPGEELELVMVLGAAEGVLEGRRLPLAGHSPAWLSSEVSRSSAKMPSMSSGLYARVAGGWRKVGLDRLTENETTRGWRA